MASSMRRTCAAPIAALVLAAGCGGNDDGPEPVVRKAAAQAAPKDRRDLAVVAVTARIGRDRVRSAGVVTDVERGLILTTAHSVWGARSLKVATGIAVLHGRIVARDACDDLAVLETQPRLPGLVALPASADAGLPDGRTVVAVRRRGGLPGRGGPELETHHVRVGAEPARRLLPGLRPKRSTALAARTLDTDASGAPLIGPDGRLAGLAQVTADAKAALPWEVVHERLQELRPGGQAQYVGWRRHYRCSGALHRYATEHHPGYRRSDAQLNAPVPATRLAEVDEGER